VSPGAPNLSTPSAAPIEWLCRFDGVTYVVTERFAFDAKQRAAQAFGCAPGQVECVPVRGLGEST
jgi:hypothetical protein